jgi:RNA polymerase sigma-70 factor (ECF subfamily)
MGWYKTPKSSAYGSDGVLRTGVAVEVSYGPQFPEKGLHCMADQPFVPDTATPAFAVPILRMRDLTDEDVMEQLREGHPNALSILFDRFHRLVLKVALRILRDRGEAEDVMQEIFLEIFKKAGQFDRAKGSAKTWLLQYAYHRSLSRRQYLALRNFYARNLQTELDVIECHRTDVSWRGLTFQEWARVIEQGLATLNERQRKTLELVCFQGLLLSDIAERTKESLPNVRHHYYRGLQALRKFLQPAKLNREGKDDES